MDRLDIPAEALAIADDMNKTAMAEMIDPIAGGLDSPRYAMGLLPSVYEDFAADQCHIWGGNMELYAGGFLVAVASQLNGSVRVRVNADDPNSDTSILGLAMFVGNSGCGKTGVQDAITNYTKSIEDALDKEQRASAKEAGVDPGKMKHVLLTSVTLERMLVQQSINAGMPLTFAPNEASALLDGMTNHLANAYPQLADLLNQDFDNGPVSIVKQKASESDLHASSVYFNVLTSTTPARLGQWKYKDVAQRDGLLGRFDVACGSANNNFKRDATQGIPGAYDQWMTAQRRLREMQSTVFILDASLKDKWAAWVAKKKQMALALEVTSPGYASWLLKAEKRAMRYAAAFQLMEYLEDGKYTVNTEGKYGVERHVTITPETMKRAIEFHDTFLALQQRYFHDFLFVGDEMRSNAIHLFYRLLANDLRKLSREDFWGSKALPFTLRSKDQWTREKFAGYVIGHGWLRPAPGSQKRGGSGEIHSSQFEVVPGFHEKFAGYKTAATEYWRSMTEWKVTSDW